MRLLGSSSGRKQVLQRATTCAVRGFDKHISPSLFVFGIILTILGACPVSAITVFDDAFLDGVAYVPFESTSATALSIDPMVAYLGLASLKIQVPALDSATYAGGALVADEAQDLTSYNALTFYARSSLDVTLSTAGFGNDNTGTSPYAAERKNIALTSEWSYVVVPIPSAARLVAERGLFVFVDAADQQHPDGYTIWLDEIVFADLGNIEIFRASMPTGTRQYFVGSPVTLQGTSTIFRVDGAPIVVSHSPNYFDYASSDPAVVAVDGSTVEVVGTGMATVTAALEGMDVLGRLTVTGYLPPTVAAAAPTLPAADVISLFSDVYDDVPVDTWNPHWLGSTTQDEIYVIDGDNTRMYSALNYVGILFQNPLIDASAMTHLHLDVYAPAGTDFKVKLGCFPPGPTPVAETTDLSLDANSTPAFIAGDWSCLDIPLTSFALPVDWDWGHVGEIVLSTFDAQLVLVDNVMFTNQTGVPNKTVRWGDFKGGYR